MINIVVTKEFKKLFRKLDFSIQKKASNKTEIFKNNPFSKILEIEKLNPKQYKVWSFRVDLSYRIIFRFIGKNTAEFMYIGHHNKIYQYNIFIK